MITIKRICVFCGSSPGSDPVFARAARGLGRELLRRSWGLVYGGGRVGLMYEIARTMHEGGGRITGVIPREMVDRDLATKEIDDLRIVETMHERKALMTGLSDGFLALPGGFGTMEEIFEALTWAQLGIHRKPCGLLNVAGYFDPLLDFLDRAEARGFLPPEHRAMIRVRADSRRLLDLFEAYRPPAGDMARWAIGRTKVRPVRTNSR